MEQNAVQLTGLIREIKDPRSSPAGIVHRELLLEHRSRQEVAGKAREIRALVTVKVTGRALADCLQGMKAGDRIAVQGLLAQSSHHDTQQLLIHAQVIERIE